MCKACEAGCGRPDEKSRGIQPVHVPAIDGGAGKQLHEGICERETREQNAQLVWGEIQFSLDAFSSHAEIAPIGVVDAYRNNEQPERDPMQQTGLGRGVEHYLLRTTAQTACALTEVNVSEEDYRFLGCGSVIGSVEIEETEARQVGVSKQGGIEIAALEHRYLVCGHFAAIWL